MQEAHFCNSTEKNKSAGKSSIVRIMCRLQAKRKLNTFVKNVCASAPSYLIKNAHNLFLFYFKFPKKKSKKVLLTAVKQKPLQRPVAF